MNRESNETSGPAQKRYILTNRMNLNAMLSSRIIGPRTFYTKYYPDLLELGPGSVPVLSEPPSTDLVDLVSAHARTGPALLEITAPTTTTPPTPVSFVEAIPMASVTAIHLPSETSLREHEARRYRNIHPHSSILKVTPALFTGPASRSDVVRAASSEHLPAPRGAETWHRIDRMRGSLTACIAAADDDVTLRAAADVIDTNLPAMKGRLLSLLDPSRPPELHAADRALTAAVLEVLIDADVQRAWDPTAVIDSIRRTVTTHDATAVIVTANLDRVTEIVTARVPFTPFRPGGRGLTGAKALLLVLLREELAELLAWSPAETGADQRTRQLAAVFAGTLRGLSREAIRTRSLHLDDLTAHWACNNKDHEPQTADIAVLPDGNKRHLVINGATVRTVGLTDISTS